MAQSCLTPCDPMDCSLPGSSFPGISQARILSGLPFPTSGDLPDLGIEPTSLVSPALAGGFVNHCTSWKWRTKSKCKELPQDHQVVRLGESHPTTTDWSTYIRPLRYFKENRTRSDFLYLRVVIMPIRVICHQRVNIQDSKSSNHILPNTTNQELNKGIMATDITRWEFA